MRERPSQLWLLVGGNGAGKTTFYETRLKPLGLPFVNADLIAKEVSPSAPEEASYLAAKLAEGERMRLLESGQNFCFETVFSHPSKIDFIAQAKALGYEIVLVWIHLSNSWENIARVAQRVESGGHNVPQDKIESRIERLVTHIKTAIPLCDYVHCFDNSSYDKPYQKVFSLERGRLVRHKEDLPSYAVSILKDLYI